MTDYTPTFPDGEYTINKTLIAVVRNGITWAFVTEGEPEASAPRLKEERDELLEALIGMMELHRLTQAHNVNTEWRETIVKKANAIIAKVEK